MEVTALGVAVACYGLACCAAIAGAMLLRRTDALVVAFLAAGLAAHALSIGLRWDRVGHGPFISMFEVLSSNVWSLTLVFLAAFAAVKQVRPSAVVALPLLLVLAAWMFATYPDDGHFPPTYRTLWLYAHVGFGKVFLGALLVASAISALLLAARAEAAAHDANRHDVSLERLALRFLVLAFVFESLMLVTGAIWAQDAWGRWWAWDPLETWSFLTWIALAFVLHARVTLRMHPKATAAMIVAVFVLAFLTFFGMPFVSTALHKGAV